MIKVSVLYPNKAGAKFDMDYYCDSHMPPFAAKLKPALKGMTEVAFSGEEPGAAARVVKAFTKDNEKLKIKAGLLDGQVLDAKTVENQLATLPGKDEARAMLLATLMAPAQRFVMLLNTPAGNFVRLLEAKKAKG